MSQLNQMKTVRKNNSKSVRSDCVSDFSELREKGIEIPPDFPILIKHSLYKHLLNIENEQYLEKLKVIVNEFNNNQDIENRKETARKNLETFKNTFARHVRKETGSTIIQDDYVNDFSELNEKGIYIPPDFPIKITHSLYKHLLNVENNQYLEKFGNIINEFNRTQNVEKLKEDMENFKVNFAAFNYRKRKTPAIKNPTQFVSNFSELYEKEGIFIPINFPMYITHNVYKHLLKSGTPYYTNRLRQIVNKFNTDRDVEKTKKEIKTFKNTFSNYISNKLQQIKIPDNFPIQIDKRQYEHLLYNENNKYFIRLKSIVDDIHENQDIQENQNIMRRLNLFKKDFSNRKVSPNDNNNDNWSELNNDGNMEFDETIFGDEYNEDVDNEMINESESGKRKHSPDENVSSSKKANTSDYNYDDYDVENDLQLIELELKGGKKKKTKRRKSKNKKTKRRIYYNK